MNRREVLAAIGVATGGGCLGADEPTEELRLPPPDDDRLISAESDPAGPFGSVPSGDWIGAWGDVYGRGYSPSPSIEDRRLRWRTRVVGSDREFVGVVTVVGARVVVAARNLLVGLRLRDGEVAWRRQLELVRDRGSPYAPDTPTAAARYSRLGHRVARILPPVAGPDGTVYVPAEHGLTALDPADGSTLWRGSKRTDGIPVASSEGVFFRNRDGFHAVSRSGQQLWTLSDDTGLPVRFARPVVVDGLVVGGNGGELTALDAATGTVAWQADGVVQTKTVTDGQFVYGSGYESLDAYRVEDGSRAWSHETADSITKLVLGGDTVYGAGQGGFVAAPSAVGVATADGTRRWANTGITDGYETRSLRPVAATDGGVLVRVTPEEEFTPREGPIQLALLDRASGQFTTGVTSRVPVGLPAVLEDALIVPRHNGSVVAFG